MKRDMNVASSKDSTTGDVPIVKATRLVKQVPMGDTLLTILHGVDLTVAKGETLAIVGASGSGKSTLLGLLAGLDVPSEGEVWLGGANLTTLNEDGRARVRGNLVGFVFQSFQLLPALTALENVMLPLELAAKPDAERSATEWLQKVGLGARLSHYPKQLSGGEQQRVALARAFAGNPQLLFADEPTGNLDTATGQQIVELLFELNRAQGTTLVLVTHDSQLAARCHRHVRIAAGRIDQDDAA
ncbi:ABC transporter ATP-binding protein [Chitinivorax sp. B]|uniref:ABC transporter ATP-binding protein n=1 Tax=Chitinivorax sp. B TaxID=2502235 RepID=UPI00148597DB|nr:ABC transporter ATP-binding protein [Chitinivorax sp. B]